MLAHQVSCAAMLFGFSIASPISKRQGNNVYNHPGANSWQSWSAYQGPPAWSSYQGSDWSSWSNDQWTSWSTYSTSMPPPTSTSTSFAESSSEALPTSTTTSSLSSTTSYTPAAPSSTTALDFTTTSSSTIVPVPTTSSSYTTTSYTSSTSASTAESYNSTTTISTSLAPVPTACVNSTISNCTATPTGGANGTDTYNFYQGDGSEEDGWPTIEDWESFDNMWANNQALIAGSCTNLGTPPDNSANETAAILSSILAIAEITAIDPRFILAVMMQESKACVRVITTYGSVANPGLMQDHAGNHTCNNGGVLSIPCPDDEIYGMIEDGVEGTAAGDGLEQILANNATSPINGEEAMHYYKAARMYNSGSIDPSGDLGAGGSTHCYASDIANRVMGWVFAQRTCTL